MIPSRDRLADMDTEHIEKAVSVAARGTKRNPRKWVIKKYGSQVDEPDQNLLSNIAVLNDHRVVDEVHIT